MDKSDFVKLSNVIRLNYKKNKSKDKSDKNKINNNLCLPMLVKLFRDFCEPERPNKFNSFIEFSSENFSIYDVHFQRKEEVSGKCDDAKRGAAPNFVPLMLYFLWQSCRDEMISLLENFKDIDPFISYFLYETGERTRNTKRGLMRRTYSETRMRTNTLDWEIANRRVAQERHEPSGRLRFSKLMIDTVPELSSYLPNITEVTIRSSFISSIEFARPYSYLTAFDCSYTQVKSLAGLNVGKLKYLFCAVSEISDLSLLKEAFNLERLYCGSTYIRDISPLSNCKNLKILCCEDTELSSLSGIEGCESLIYLDCSDTRITNLAPLTKLPYLREIVLNGCHIDNSIKEICELKSLEKLIFYQGKAEGIPENCLSLESYDNCLPRIRNYLKIA